MAKKRMTVEEGSLAEALVTGAQVALVGSAFHLPTLRTIDKHSGAYAWVGSLCFKRATGEMYPRAVKNSTRWRIRLITEGDRAGWKREATMVGVRTALANLAPWDVVNNLSDDELDRLAAALVPWSNA